MKQLNNSWY